MGGTEEELLKYDAGKDYYEVLGVRFDATPEEIDRAYRSQARRAHPDSGGSEEEMKSLNEAHDLLSDPETRSAYDQDRRPPPIAYGTSYAFDPDASARVGSFETPVDDEGVAGSLISAATGLGLGLPFLILVETQWFFFLWPLRILAVCLIGFGILMANSALSAYHRRLGKAEPESGRGKRFRTVVILQKMAFWVIVLASIVLVFVGLNAK